MQVVVDSLLTQYEVQGKGKLVVLLHGWGDSSKGMSGLQKTLARQFQVLAVDLPGFGGTQAPTVVWGLNEYAQFVAHFLKKIDMPQVSLFVGHSNGGAIAIRGLVKDWLQADKLVLLASAGIRGEYQGRMKALRLVTKAGKALTQPLPKVIKQKLRKRVYNTIGSDMLVAEHLQETFKKVVTDDVRGDASRLMLPTLLIYGEEDTVTPIRFGELFHEAIESSTLEILPGAGHFVHLDRPADVSKAIEEFA
ncbi:MAG TPA: alpha/beta hydrolase [Patescibacteria group bacterium]|nr:alpha/beta hydrolase [Patescibacteria group bacterium]